MLSFEDFCLNESSLKKIKKILKGSLDTSKDRSRMKKALRNNIVTFKFSKRNGEVRTAHGTLYPDFLPALRGGSPRPEHQMVYFDMDKDGWRSFRTYKFIKILKLKPVTEKEIDDFKLEKEIEKDRKKAMLKKEESEKGKVFKKIKGDDEEEDVMDSLKHHEEKVRKKKEKHDEPVKKKKEKSVVDRMHEDGGDIDKMVSDKKDDD